MRRLRDTVVMLGFVLGLASIGACGDDPCTKLELRVCKERPDKARCKLIKDTKRREHLSSEACDNMLKALKR